MTTRFRIEGVELDTTHGDVLYRFDSDLVVLAGQTGVGKTTLLELIKYALGGDGLLAPVARDHVLDVHVTLEAGSEKLRLSRSIDVERSGIVRVLDVASGRRRPDRSVGGDADSVSSLLLGAMGLPVGLRAPARGGRSTSAGPEITFNDVLRFMYVPQAEINRDIAHSKDGYYDPKRKTIFELFFGLTSAATLELRSRVNTLKAEADAAKTEAAAVIRFLGDSRTSDRLSTEARLVAVRAAEDEAVERLASLRGMLTEAMDDRTRTLREILRNAEASLSNAETLVTELAQQERDYRRERERIERDIQRFERMGAAGHQLASIDFLICPRCTQSLQSREVEGGLCPVCTLPDPIDNFGHSPAHDEVAQLRLEIDDIDGELALIRRDATDASLATESRRELVASLTAEINLRTSNRVTPQLQAYADASATIESSRAEKRSLEGVLQQWDRAEDLASRAETLASERERLRRDLQSAEQALAERRAEIMAELSDEFARTVVAFGIPSITSASIDEATYLPLLNAQPYDRVSRAGGIVTATQVAYWLTIVTVAVRRRDTSVPTFLLIDSPRLALNNQELLARQMYRRFVTQVGANPGLAQFIIADNELPAEYGGEFIEIDFDYDSPTVPTVAHPGPARVERLVEEN